MSVSTIVDTALCVAAPENEALLQGRLIATLPRIFIEPGRKFALCPIDSSINLLEIEQYYRPSFLSIAKTDFDSINAENVQIKAWARCELCQSIYQTESLAALSSLTIWTQQALQNILAQKQNIFLAYLRVYQLSKAIEVPVKHKQNSQFVALPQPLSVTDANPVLSDRIFIKRKHQLEKLEPPLYPELEELQSSLASFAITNLAAKALEEDIKVFLGWGRKSPSIKADSDVNWINNIAALGNRSKQQDEGKSNYQAGTDFENIVRQSLEYLGFTVDYFHKGGAGGIDIFCSQPYSLVGECKAGKKIPNDTAVQLLNLGTLRLKSQEIFKQATKLIIGPGEPTTQLQDAAKVHDMAIINPETLEKLVKLQSTYQNSVDLFKLKQYLKAGQSDQEVEKYIDQVNREISLRSHIIQAVKELSEQDKESLEVTSYGFTITEIRAHYNATHSPKQTDETVSQWLIELSSPLTGYLGRIKASDWKSDRFYFLRDLPIITNYL